MFALRTVYFTLVWCNINSATHTANENTYWNNGPSCKDVTRYKSIQILGPSYKQGLIEISARINNYNDSALYQNGGLHQNPQRT